MKSKSLQFIQYTLLALMPIIHLTSKYAVLEFNFELIIWIIAAIYLKISCIYIASLDQTTSEFPNSFFPYKPTFIGVDQWLIAIPWMGIGIAKLITDDFYLGLMLLTAYSTLIIERLVKNHYNLFNVEFTNDRIKINETVKNEILYQDISSINLISKRKIKLELTGKKGYEIMNINRIDKRLRGKFKSQILALEPVPEN